MHRRSADRRRWVGVGTSRRPDADAAGREAVDAALAGADDARLLVVFAADRDDLEGLVGGIRAGAPGVPLVGCTTAGEISRAGIADDSVVVTALGGPGFAVDTGLVRGVADDLHAAGVAAGEVATRTAPGEDHPHRVLLLLSDGLAGDQQAIVRGAYATLGATVPLVGGCAGDALRMERTRQFHGDEVASGAVVAAAISSDAPIGIGVRHGWERAGEPLLVTESRDNRVHRLDDRPALDAYLDRLDAPAEAREDPDAFRRFAITHPLGLERRSGVEVRFVGDRDAEERSLLCIAEVPQGELAHPLAGGVDTVLDATEAACRGACADLGDVEPLGALAFDCIGRREVLGEDPDAELARIRGCFGDAPFAGFYTYGEFARTSGPRGFHNQTLVLLALA